MVELDKLKNTHQELINFLISQSHIPLVKDYLNYTEYIFEKYLTKSNSDNIEFVKLVPFRLNRYLSEFNFDTEISNKIDYYIDEMMKTI